MFESTYLIKYQKLSVLVPAFQHPASFDTFTYGFPPLRHTGVETPLHAVTACALQLFHSSDLKFACRTQGSLYPVSDYSVAGCGSAVEIFIRHDELPDCYYQLSQVAPLQTSPFE